MSICDRRVAHRVSWGITGVVVAVLAVVFVFCQTAEQLPTMEEAVQLRAVATQYITLCEYEKALQIAILSVGVGRKAPQEVQDLLVKIRETKGRAGMLLLDLRRK